jgi:hypothetical protein
MIAKTVTVLGEQGIGGFAGCPSDRVGRFGLVGVDHFPQSL